MGVCVRRAFFNTHRQGLCTDVIAHCLRCQHFLKRFAALVPHHDAVCDIEVGGAAHVLDVVDQLTRQPLLLQLRRHPSVDSHIVATVKHARVGTVLGGRDVQVLCLQSELTDVDGLASQHGPDDSFLVGGSEGLVEVRQLIGVFGAYDRPVEPDSQVLGRICVADDLH